MIEHPAWFNEFLKSHKRIAIAGGPRTGKTTLAMTVRDRPVLSTDSYMHINWSHVPPIVIDAVKDLESFILEGVQVPRCLRKGLRVDAVVWLSQPHARQTDGQKAMSKACSTVFNEWFLSHKNKYGEPVVHFG